MPQGSARSGWNKQHPGTLSVPLASSKGLDPRLSVKEEEEEGGVCGWPPEELRPARRRGKEIPSRRRGPRDLKMRTHCCSVACPRGPAPASWDLLPTESLGGGREAGLGPGHTGCSPQHRPKHQRTSVSKAPPDPGTREWAVHHTWVCNTKTEASFRESAELSPQYCRVKPSKPHGRVLFSVFTIWIYYKSKNNKPTTSSH